MGKCEYNDVIRCNSDQECFWGEKTKYGFTWIDCHSKTKDKKGVTKLRNSYIDHLKNNLLVRANMALENAKIFNNKEKIMKSEEIIRQIKEQINSPLKIIYPDLYRDVTNLSDIENSNTVKEVKEFNVEELLDHGYSNYDIDLYRDLYEKSPSFKKQRSRAREISKLREEIKDLENKSRSTSEAVKEVIVEVIVVEVPVEVPVEVIVVEVPVEVPVEVLVVEVHPI